MTDRSILYPKHALKEYDENGDWTGKWDCKNCHQIYDHNSQNNIIKSLRDRRTGNLTYERHILGDNCEDLTCIIFGVKRLSVEYDKYSRLSVDHGPITKQISTMIGYKLIYLYGKVPQTKGRCYSPRDGRWDTKSEKDKKFNILILYCLSEDGKTIERIYIIPKEKVVQTSGINICKNPTDSWGNHITSLYEEYKVTDEMFLEEVNKEWKEIIRE